MKCFPALVLVLTLSSQVFPCFDTYLFLNKQSMVYSEKQLVIDGSGEYSANHLSQPGQDAFFADFKAFYGISNRLSVQASLGSSEKERHAFQLDNYGVRGVFNLLNKGDHEYNVDFIVEHGNAFKGNAASLEASLPLITHQGNWTGVVHPVLGIMSENESAVEAGGHIGLFRRFGTLAVVGLGSEYREQAASASLFFGAKIGPYLFLQNEINKNVVNSRDFGFASTVKIILPSFSR